MEKAIITKRQRLAGGSARFVSRFSCVVGIMFASALLPSSVLAEMRTFDLAGFDGIEASSGIHVIADVAETYSVVAESDDPTQLDRVEVDVRRGTLRVRMVNGLLPLRKVRGFQVTVRVSSPELIHAEALSGARIEANSMEGDILELIASSGARIEVDTLSGKTVSAEASSGAQIIAVAGKCYSLNAKASSGARLELNDMVCSRVEVGASGGSSASIHADESIDANASSGSTINVHGTRGDIDINSSGGGKISFQ